MLITPPRIIKRIYPSLIWSFPNDKDGVFLTFDDGPSPQITPWILDQLDIFGAKATFFCIGKNVELYPNLYKEILDRGHQTGNHSYSHIKGWKTDNNTYMRDIDTANDLIRSNLFRPPYAKITPSQAKEVNERYTILMWSILSRDYNRSLTGNQCARNVIPHILPGSIIVFHDSLKASKNLWYALPKVLEEIGNRGLICKRIEL